MSRKGSKVEDGEADTVVATTGVTNTSTNDNALVPSNTMSMMDASVTISTDNVSTNIDTSENNDSNATRRRSRTRTNSQIAGPYDNAHVYMPGFIDFLLGVLCWKRKPGWDTKRTHVRKFSRADTGAVTCISIAYFCFSFTAFFLPLISPAIQADPLSSYTTVVHAQIMIVNGICLGLGKLVNGFIIDHAQEPRMFLVAVGILSPALVLALTYMLDLPTPEQQFTFTILITSVNAFLQAGVWGSLSKYMFRRFRPAQYGFAISTVALAGRFGTVLTALLIGTSLYEFGSWQVTLRLCCLISFLGLLPLLFTFQMGFLAPLHQVLLAGTQMPLQDSTASDRESTARDRLIHPLDRHDAPAPDAKKNPKKIAVRNRCGHYIGWLADPSFVLMNIIVGSLYLPISFEGFLAIFLANVFSTTPSASSVLSSFVPAGVIISLVFGGYFLERLSRPSRANAVVLLCFVLLVVSTILTVWTALHPDNGGCDNACHILMGGLLFIAGFCEGYPFYLPPSQYALTFGEDSAMAAGIFDATSAALAAAYAGVASVMAETDNYLGIVSILVPASFSAVVAYIGFHYIQLKKKKEVKTAFKIISMLPADRQVSKEEIEKLVEQHVWNQPDSIAAGSPSPASLALKDKIVAHVLSALEKEKEMEEDGIYREGSSDSMGERFRSPRETIAGHIKTRHSLSPGKVRLIAAVFITALAIFFCTYFVTLLNPDSPFANGFWNSLGL